MQDLPNELVRCLKKFAPVDGVHQSPVSGVQCVRVSRNGERAKRCWRASLTIVAQGCKELTFGRDAYRFDDAHYILTAVALPVTSKIIVASQDRPFLGLWLDFDPLIVRELTTSLEEKCAEEAAYPMRGVFMNQASDKVLSAALRLSELFATPEDALVLGPLVIKELYFHLLRGPHGPVIRKFLRTESKTHQISQAIHRINTELREDVDVVTLADSVNMSRSVFFKCFKEVTAMSPIQYQKRLRLLEARRLMVEDGETAEGSAYQVGYKSASQFSREYARMFGDPPLRDTLKVKQISASLAHQ